MEIWIQTPIAAAGKDNGKLKCSIRKDIQLILDVFSSSEKGATYKKSYLLVL